MNAKGPVNWYLSVKYDRDPMKGAVSAHQHLYTDKLLKKWGMEQCNPLPAPFPQKAAPYTCTISTESLGIDHQRGQYYEHCKRSTKP